MASGYLAAGRREASLDEQLAGLRVARDHYHALADQVREEFSAADVPLLAWGQERDVRRIAEAYEKSIANMSAKAALRGEKAPRPSASIEMPRWLLLALCAAAIVGCTAGLMALTHASLPEKSSDAGLTAPLVTIPVAAPRSAMPAEVAPPHVVLGADKPDAAVTPAFEKQAPFHRVLQPAAHRHAVPHKKSSRTRKHQSLRPSALNRL